MNKKISAFFCTALCGLLPAPCASFSHAWAIERHILQKMENMSKKIDELFESSFSQFPSFTHSPFPTLSVKKGEKEDEIVCEALLEEFAKDEISLQIDTADEYPLLVIKAKKRAEHHNSSTEQKEKEKESASSSQKESTQEENVSGKEQAENKKAEEQEQKADHTEKSSAYCKQTAVMKTYLPKEVDPTTVKASFDKGLLRITLKMQPTDKKKISVSIE